MKVSEHAVRNAYVFGVEGPYDESEFFRWQRQKLKTIGRIIADLPRKERLADVGCYTGLASAIYRQAGASQIDGFDASSSALEIASKRGLNVFQWDCDSEPCPQVDNSYDIVVAADIIEHLVNTDAFVRELHRIVKPQGHVIVSTPNLASWRNRVRLFRGKPPTSFPGTSSTVGRDFWIDCNHIRVNVLSEWTFLLEQHDFRVEAVVGSTYLQALGGGLIFQVMRVIDRLSLRFPTLAVGLIIVASPSTA